MRSNLCFLPVPVLMSILLASCVTNTRKEARKTESLLHFADSFYAAGVTEPLVQYMEPSFKAPREVNKIACEVHFDLVPTKMRFSMPCYPCMVTENNIHYSSGWTETYDPKASSSCEILWDKQAQTARMWIESQNPARIIVRFRAAIADPEGYVGHSYIPSGSPYGEGDWTDEWYYIYPDGMHTRHVRIYTGLAGQSLTVTDEQFKGMAPVREIPPSVVHEFHEVFIFGQDQHVPGDDIETEALTFIKMDGSSRNISFEPYPRDFGDFTMANIMVVNTRSDYRPYTIFLPYGLENQPYPLEGHAPHVFQTWPSDPGDKGYSVSLGHALNWWHYRRNDTILEQVYLSGMVNSDDPANELLPLAESWLHFPRLLMEGHEVSYTQPVYDQAQRAYIIPGAETGPRKIAFQLGFPEEFEEEIKIPVNIVNPAFIVPEWGKSDVIINVDGRELKQGEDYRAGYEEGKTGTNLVIWINFSANKKTVFEILPG